MVVSIWLDQKEGCFCGDYTNPIYNLICIKILDKQTGTNDFKKKIFISYCHEDKDWLTIIMKYLKGLEYEGMEIWFDKKIKTGDEWNPVIKVYRFFQVTAFLWKILLKKIRKEY